MQIMTTNGTKLKCTVLSRRAQETWDSKPMVSSTPDFNFLTKVILIKTCFKGEENILGLSMKKENGEMPGWISGCHHGAYVSDDRHI